MSVAAPAPVAANEGRTLGLKRQFAWSVAPLLVLTLVNLISVRLFFRYLGDEMYALWGYVATFGGIFGFADLGLGVAVGRYIGVALGKGDQEALREYWGTGNLVALPLLGLMGAIFAGTGVLFGSQWFNVTAGNVNLLRACFVCGGFALFFNYYGQFWLILSQAYLDFRFIGILRTSITVLQIGPAILLAWLTSNPLWIIGWSTMMSLLQLLIFVWHSRRRFGLRMELSHARSARAKEMASYTGKIFAGMIVGSVFGSIDRFLLGKFASATDFANYTNGAANVGMRLQNLGVGVMGPVFHNTTRAVGGGREEAPAAIYNETFDFIFGWYLLAALVAAIWHPVLLRIWLGPDRGMQVTPFFTPVIVAFCLTAISNISAAQLGALNRMGISLIFSTAAGILAAAGVYIGWKTDGVTGAAYGFLCSRIAFLAQDFYTILLIKAGGWLSSRTWIQIAGQTLAGLFFACAYFIFPKNSNWLVIPAVFHGGLVSAWLSRRYIRKFLWNQTFFPVAQS